MTKRDRPTYCPCLKCGEPVTWFNYRNIWQDGEIVDREHIDCNAPDILEFKAKRGGNHAL